MELLGRGWVEGGGVHKWMEMEGEPQRMRRGICCKILLRNPSFSAAGILHLLKMEERKKNSFAISARCPEGAGLPQSRRSVLLSPARVLLSRRRDSGTHTAILIVSAWSGRADSDALTLPACALMFTGTDQPSAN